MSNANSDERSNQLWQIFLDEASELLRRIEDLLNACLQTDPALMQGGWLELRRALHTLKGAASVAGAENVKVAVHALEDRVGAAPPADANSIETFLAEVARIRLMLNQKSEAGETSGKAPEEAVLPTEGEYLRMRPDRIDALHTLAGELVVTRLQQAALAERLLQLRDQTEEAVRAFRKMDSLLRHQRTVQNAATLDALGASSRSVSGMLAAIMHEVGTLSRDLPVLNEQAAVVSASLEDSIRELRLMPLQPFFREYTQVVRDAAKECGKKANLVVRAEGAEIDRAVMLRLREPLLHMVRNAVGHGIESPKERVISGKSETGRVLLEARSEGTRVIIQIGDDGGGIDLNAVRKRAQALHLLEANQEVTESEILELLAHPGFSTQERTDRLAGRGIGLDVARASVHSLGGRMSLQFLQGVGCTFTIEVPITASSNIGLLLRVNQDIYCVLLNQVDRVLRLSVKDLQSCEGRSTVDIQDATVAAVILSELLGLPTSVAQERRPAVVLSHGTQRLVLIVDDLPGEQALVIKPLGRAFGNAQLFLGGAVQADHSIVPVLNVPALFERAASRRPVSNSLGLRPSTLPEAASVLVVDDSLTLRMLLRNILQTAGYEVTVTQDGMAALEELQRMKRCDLIISDLQMPRMDGCELCKKVRSSNRPNLPLMIVTSVGDAEEQAKALAAGADAYLIKAEFEQGHFLDKVAELIGSVHESPAS